MAKRITSWEIYPAYEAAIKERIWATAHLLTTAIVAMSYGNPDLLCQVVLHSSPGPRWAALSNSVLSITAVGGGSMLVPVSELTSTDALWLTLRAGFQQRGPVETPWAFPWPEGHRDSFDHLSRLFDLAELHELVLPHLSPSGRLWKLLAGWRVVEAAGVASFAD
jgi:hypothetical protein